MTHFLLVSSRSGACPPYQTSAAGSAPWLKNSNSRQLKAETNKLQTYQK